METINRRVFSDFEDEGILVTILTSDSIHCLDIEFRGEFKGVPVNEDSNFTIIGNIFMDSSMGSYKALDEHVNRIIKDIKVRVGRELTLSPEQNTVEKSILTEIAEERQRQDDKWGVRFHDDHKLWLTIMTEEVGESAKSILEYDRDNLRKELIQIAAVCVNWAASMDLEEGNE